MIDSNGKFHSPKYIEQAFGVPPDTLGRVAFFNMIKTPKGFVLNVCIDYPKLTDDIKLLRKLDNKFCDMECWEAFTDNRQRFFSFKAKGDTFWLHFGHQERSI